MTDLRSAVVTGATGLVGSALCRCLTEAGIRVYAVARPGSVRADHVPAEAETVFCALADLARLPSMIPEADAFFHLGWEGAFGPARQDRPLQEDNVRCAVLAAEAAKTLG